MDLAANEEIRVILDPSLAKTAVIDEKPPQQGGETPLASTSTDGGDSAARGASRQGILKNVFNDQELSTIVQQAQDVNAQGNDLAPARIREKERQLGQCEAQVI